VAADPADQSTPTGLVSLPNQQAEGWICRHRHRL